MKLNRLEEGEKLYRILLSMNPDNYRWKCLYFCYSFSVWSLTAREKIMILVGLLFWLDTMKDCKSVLDYIQKVVNILLMKLTSWSRCTSLLGSNTLGLLLLRWYTSYSAKFLIFYSNCISFHYLKRDTLFSENPVRFFGGCKVSRCSR